MTTDTNVRLQFEAQGAMPNFRYDIIQPLLQGRVDSKGLTITTTGPTASAGYWENPKYRSGDFELLDNNWGDVIPAIDNGWDIACLPLFIKRKPALNFLWVRADRGIDKPKDLEGRTIAVASYASAIATFTRGYLQHELGVDISQIRWLVNAEGRFPVHKPVQVEVATGARKTAVQRVLDGDADGLTGDITDAQAWEQLESNPNVKRMFSDYQQRNRELWTRQQIFTPVHFICMGGKLDRAQPGLARRVFDVFQASKEVALSDALGEGTSYSMFLHMREQFGDQLKTLGDMYPYGMKANQAVISAFLDYNYEQGLTKTRMSPEQVFAKSTLDT